MPPADWVVVWVAGGLEEAVSARICRRLPTAVVERHFTDGAPLSGMLLVACSSEERAALGDVGGVRTVVSDGDDPVLFQRTIVDGDEGPTTELVAVWPDGDMCPVCGGEIGLPWFVSVNWAENPDQRILARCTSCEAELERTSGSWRRRVD